MIDVAALRALVAAGVSASAIVDAIEADQKAEAERRAEVRERERIRKRNQRSCPWDTADSAGQLGQEPAPSKVPPTPPLSTPQGSEAYASADVVGEEPKARLFRLGKPILVTFGIAEKKTGALIGQWLKMNPDPAGLLAAIQFARDQNVAEPVAYVSAVINKRKGKSNGKQPSLGQVAIELAAEVRARERAAGIGGADDLFRSH